MSEEKKKVLNLVMRQKYALEILRGEKVREFRPASDHWLRIMGEFNDPKEKGLLTGVKKFDIVHFYNYRNDWHLDCKIKGIICATIDDEFSRHIPPTEYEGKKGDAVFIIWLGDVVSTNLKV